MRGALIASAVMNMGAALLFAFPDSLGQVAGLPTPVPRIYTTLLAAFVMLFGVAYAWLSRRPIIDRPLVAFSAFGKAGVFAVIIVFWILGDLSGRSALAAIGDLVFAAIFVRWLIGGRAIANVSVAHGAGSQDKAGEGSVTTARGQIGS
jgi:hypothetical protein